MTVIELKVSAHRSVGGRFWCDRGRNRERAKNVWRCISCSLARTALKSLTHIRSPAGSAYLVCLMEGLCIASLPPSLPCPPFTLGSGTFTPPKMESLKSSIAHQLRAIQQNEARALGRVRSRRHVLQKAEGLDTASLGRVRSCPTLGQSQVSVRSPRYLRC